MKQIKTYLFIFILAFASSLILAIVSTSLTPAQIYAKNSYQNKELLTAADLLPLKAKSSEIDKITQEKIIPMLTDSQGNSFTFAEKNINYTDYLSAGEKSGFSALPFKLFYKIKDGGVILPLNGFGLWDAIYGYIGIEKNGYRILAISCYEQKETPGLGGEIQNPSWQKQFKGKTLFHGNKMESFGLDFISKEMLRVLPPSEQEYNIDAISGATITTKGVQAAIKNSLSPYIPLLRKMQKP